MPLQVQGNAVAQLSKEILPPALLPRPSKPMINTSVSIVKKARLAMPLSVSPYRDWQNTEATHILVRGGMICIHPQ